MPTFVSRRFVDCSADGQGLALLHDGLLEYEVVDRGSAAPQELALTLVRATGYLSRSELSLRPNPAGPTRSARGTPTPTTPSPSTTRLMPHRGDWQDAALHEAADEFLVPLEAVRGGGWPGANGPHTGHTIAVTGGVVSALRRETDGRVLVRLFNPTRETTEATIEGRSGLPWSGRSSI